VGPSWDTPPLRQQSKGPRMGAQRWTGDCWRMREGTCVSKSERHWWVQVVLTQNPPPPVTGTVTPTLFNQSLPNSPILLSPKPYLVLRDTLCSCEAYGMKPMKKKKRKTTCGGGIREAVPVAERRVSGTPRMRSKEKDVYSRYPPGMWGRCVWGWARAGGGYACVCLCVVVGTLIVGYKPHIHERKGILCENVCVCVGGGGLLERSKGEGWARGTYQCTPRPSRPTLVAPDSRREDVIGRMLPRLTVPAQHKRK
jgi:hypothetical protein